MAQSDGQAQTQGALNRMILREEVLQICYWYQGEGFGDLYAPDTLQPFLNNNRAAIQAALRSLQEGGYLEAASEAISAYRFTEKGRKEGGPFVCGGICRLPKNRARRMRSGMLRRRRPLRVRGRLHLALTCGP